MIAGGKDFRLGFLWYINLIPSFREGMGEQRGGHSDEHIPRHTRGARRKYSRTHGGQLPAPRRPPSYTRLLHTPLLFLSFQVADCRQAPSSSSSSNLRGCSLIVGNFRFACFAPTPAHARTGTRSQFYTHGRGRFWGSRRLARSHRRTHVDERTETRHWGGEQRPWNLPLRENCGCVAVLSCGGGR